MTDYETIQRLLRPQGRIIEGLVQLHCPLPAPTILDPSFNKGGMWKSCAYQPTTKSDSNPRAADVHKVRWADLPVYFAGQWWDIVVWDPPHNPGVGKGSQRYAVYEDEDEPLTGPNVVPLFEPFLIAVRPLVAPGGMLLIKIKDINHSNATQWQVAELYAIARRLGWRMCSYAESLPPSLTDDPKWQTEQLEPKPGCVFVVLHPDGDAPCPGQQRKHLRPRARTCSECGKPFRGRADARYCGPTCRQRARRAN